MNKRHFYILVFIFGASIASFALAPPPPPPPDEPGCWPPPCVPIDGGITLLIAAGAVYGARKLYLNQKEKDNF